MTITLLGATGRTGRIILEMALERGHIVKALVRDKTRVKTTASNLTLIQGNPLDRQALRQACTGSQAVISALNISRTSDFPWAGLRTPPDLLSKTMANLIEIARELELRRIAVISAWGANETLQDIPGWFRWFIRNSNIGHAYRDHERQENLLQATDLDWTIVRPVGLTNSAKEKTIKVSFNNEPEPGLTIGRRDLARFILDSVERDQYIRQLPTISN